MIQRPKVQPKVLGRIIGITCILAVSALAQQSMTVQLVIDTANDVNYYDDVTDYGKLATTTAVTPPAAARNFTRSINIADIVAVNGAPARGAATGEFSTLTMQTSLSPGQAIADFPSGSLAHWTYTVRTADGDPVGSILIQGLGFAPKPPGTSTSAVAGDFAVIGGTGAFAGVRGQAAFAPLTTGGGRNASVTEDPAMRRTLGGAAYRLFLNLVVDHPPAFVQAPGGFAFTHSADGSLVTEANPAKPGEILSVYVSGLGPTNPPLQPGTTFPSGQPSVVASPIQITVGGASAEVLYAGGYPGTSDFYQINFRVPSGAGTGPVPLHWSVAWIPGTDATISIR